MTTSARDDLTELHGRLSGGICPAALRGRLGNWPAGDTAALQRWNPAADFMTLGKLRSDSWDEESNVGKIVSDLAKRFRGDRPLLLAMLYHPASTLDRLRATAPGGAVGAWAGLCWSAEAAWQAVNDAGSPLAPVRGYAAGDREVLAPLAARLRFLALSEPMRWRAELGRAWWASDADMDFEGTELVRRVRGAEAWHILVGECQEARRAWLDYLGAYQSYPALVQAWPGEFESELAAVVFRHGRGAPLSLSGERLTDPAALTAGDEAIIGEITSQHLLPRFDMLRVLSIAGNRGRGWPSVPRVTAGAVAVACAVDAVVSAIWLKAQWGAGFSAACYLVIGCGILAFGPTWAGPWLLRMPAAAAVGVIALIGMMAGGWLGTSHMGLAAAAVFIAASCGYLAVQLRNHGVSGWALGRSLAVAGIGMVHALLVSLLGLVYVAPAFAPRSSHLSDLWRSPGYWHAGVVLLLSTAWCLGVGVFSQILWDDRPVTSPLAHLSWRK